MDNILVTIRTLVDSCSTMDCQSMISHATFSQHDIIHIQQIPTDSTTKVDQDVFVHQVYIPTPAVLLPVITDDNAVNANTFTFEMRQLSAQCINLQRIPLRQTNYTGCRVSATDYYDFMRADVRDRFNFRIVPEQAMEIVFLELRPTYFSVMRVNIIIDTFEQSPYVSALCGLPRVQCTFYSTTS